MLDDENEFLPPRAEEIPERLAKKWEEQEKREGLTRCKSCKKQILAASAFCAYCGRPLISNRAWIIPTAVVLLLILFIFGARIFYR